MKNETIGIYVVILTAAIPWVEQTKYTLHLSGNNSLKADPKVVKELSKDKVITRDEYPFRINQVLKYEHKHNVRLTQYGLGVLVVNTGITPGEELSLDCGTSHDWSNERGELMSRLS
jgi:hypothetical protein